MPRNRQKSGRGGQFVGFLDVGHDFGASQTPPGSTARRLTVQLPRRVRGTLRFESTLRHSG